MSSDNDHIKWFRASSPYINAHRSRTFVIHLGGAAILHENFQNVINDIALLHSLGVKLILVHGAGPQIASDLAAKELSRPVVDELPVTTPEVLGDIIATIGRTRTSLEGHLSRGRPPMPPDITVTSGNFVKAKPIGIREGTDYHHTGTTRKINDQAIRSQLENKAIVMISPLGHSPSGETFVLHSRQLAQDVACAVLADKLIYFTTEDGIRDSEGGIINELSQMEDSRWVQTPQQVSLVKLTTQACMNGVNRCHIISYSRDGALLEELFTRDGSGTQITRESYEQLRVATPDDVAGIIALISPLEREGQLVRRSRELIESEVDHFRVIERDGMIVACAALYPFESMGELACLATHPDYRNDNRGELLLQTIETTARNQGINTLFVLTTQSVHWFLERGFSECPIDVLPASRKSFYNLQRNSKYLQKTLQIR